MCGGVTMTASCPLCGSTTGRVMYTLTAAATIEDVPGTVIACDRCPMWFKALAPGTTLPIEYPGEVGDDPIAAAYLLGDTARELFRTALTPLAPRPGAPARLLDIGAGQGALLEEAARLGFTAEGLEHAPGNVAAARARGLAMHHGTAETLDAQAAYDVITLMDVIEHLLDPLAVLRRVHAALRPGGTLVVYTPNHRALVVGFARLLHAAGVRGPLQEFFGRNHVAFFDDRSLPLALARAGFQLLGMERFRYDPTRPGQEVSAAQVAVVAALERLGAPFGRVMRLLAWARR